jgi:hypothetical protein
LFQLSGCVNPIESERAEGYDTRWKELKGEFVDDPRGAVQGANELVGEVLDELEELFRRQRSDLEQSLDSEQTTTEDLRQALIPGSSPITTATVG